MKSLVFWTVLGLAATVSASWMDRDVVDSMGGIQVVAQQQQVVQPQFPAQALGGREAVVNPPPQYAPSAPVSPPPQVLPRKYQEAPPQAPGVAVAQPIPASPLQRPRPPRAFPVSPPPPAQAAIPQR